MYVAYSACTQLEPLQKTVQVGSVLVLYVTMNLIKILTNLIKLWPCLCQLMSIAMQLLLLCGLLQVNYCVSQ